MPIKQLSIYEPMSAQEFVNEVINNPDVEEIRILHDINGTITNLPELPSLKKIYIHDRISRENLVTIINKATNLTTLEGSFEKIHELIANNINLEFIKQLIIRSGTINNSFIQLLAALPHLEILTFGMFCSTPSKEDRLDWGNFNLENLKELTLRPALTTINELVIILNKAKNLKILNLGNYKHLDSLNWNAVNFQHLETLNLAGSSSVDIEDIMRIISRNKSIQKVVIDRDNDADYKNLAILYSKLPDGEVKIDDNYYGSKIEQKVNYSLLANCVLAFNNEKFISNALLEGDFKDLYNFLMLGISGKIPSDVLYKHFTDTLFYDCRDDQQLNSQEMRNYIHNLWNNKIIPYIQRQEVTFNIFVNHLAASLNKDNKLQDFLRNKGWFISSTKELFEQKCRQILAEHSDVFNNPNARTDCYKRAKEIDFSQFNQYKDKYTFLDKLLEQVTLPSEQLNEHNRSKPKPR
jgi:hypothetical protein